MTLYSCLFFLFITLNSCYSSDKPSDRKFQSFENAQADSLSFIKMDDNSSPTKIKLSNLNESSRILDLNNIVESVKYISLETSRESLISGIEKMSIYKDHIYILDNLNKSLLVFSNTGKFIRKIGKYGKGPHEFINPINFIIHEDRILVLDDKNSKILIYSIEGEYLEETAVGFRFNDFLIASDSTYIVNTDTRTNHHNKAIENYKLLIVNKTWKALARGNLYDSYQCGEITFTRDALYRSSNKSILYNPMFSYHIYEFKNNNFYSKYTFDAPGMTLPENFECGLNYDDFSNKYDGQNSPYAFIDKPIIESPNWLITTFRHKAQNAFMFYNRNSGETYWGVFYDDDAKSFVFLAPIKGMTDRGQFYSHTSSLDLKNRYLKYEKNTGKKNEMLININEGDNPVIILYDLKK